MEGAQSVDVSIANLSNKTILYRYIYEKAYLEKQRSNKYAGIGVAGASLCAELSTGKTFKHTEALEPGISRLPPGHLTKLTLELKESSIVYVTIQPEGEKVIWNDLQQDKKRNIVITKDLRIKTADDKDPYKVHPDEQQEPPELELSEEQNYTNVTGGKENNPDDCKTTEIRSSTGESTEPTDTKISKEQFDSETGEIEKGFDAINEVKKMRPLRNEGKTFVIQKREISQILAKKSGCNTIADDKHPPFIRGMAVTSNETLLLADSMNNNVKSVSLDFRTYSFKVMSVLLLSEPPNDIAVLKSTTAVATAMTAKLYIIDIHEHSSLSLRKEIQLKYKVRAITSFRENVVITCSTVPCSTKMVDLKGTELWSVNAVEQKQDWYSLVTTVIKNTAAVIVTDPTTSSLTLLEAKTGSYIGTIDVEGKGPYAITVDKDGNAYICYNETNEVGVWTNDFQEYGILLSKEVLKGNPKAIAYSDVTNSLYISYFRICTLDCFPLQ